MKDMVAEDTTRSEAKRPDIPANHLFLSFLRLGITAFGGPAMVAYIRDLAVRKRRWLSQESFQDGVALCQTIPGATAMQTAAYVGLRAGGPLGALAAFVGFGLPAFVLMVILSAAYQETQDLQAVIAAFRGLHLVVIALIANAAVTFGRASIKNWRDLLLAVGAAVFLACHGNPILAITGAGLVGLLIYRAADLPAAKGPASPRDAQPRSWGPWAIVPLAAIGLAALFVFDRPLFSLAALMVRVDLFAFGGGFASVPIMLHEVVDVRHWLSHKVFMDGIALGQVTPGPIVITATFVGYQVAGLWGALIATVSIFTPSFFMVLATVPYLDRMRGSLRFGCALRGVLVSFVGLLAAVTLDFAMAVSWTALSVIVAAAAFVALRLKVDILWVVLVGVIASVAFLQTDAGSKESSGNMWYREYGIENVAGIGIRDATA